MLVFILQTLCIVTPLLILSQLLHLSEPMPVVFQHKECPNEVVKPTPSQRIVLDHESCVSPRIASN